ncbi:hypothetical protein DV737_g2748, partial [Chaetothyriales sp. CBS 132003]
MITLVDFRYNQTFNETSSDPASDGTLQALSWSTEVANVTSIACRSSYTVKKANITYDMVSTPPRASAVGPLTNLSSQLDSFSHADLGRLVTASLTAARDMFGNIQELAYATEYPNTLLKFMAALDSADYETLLDENVMILAAEKALNAIASQNFRKYLMQQASSPIQGSGLESLKQNNFYTVSQESSFLLKTKPHDYAPQAGSENDGDNGAAVLMSLTESANLSYAAFTYEELAFDRLVVANATILAKASPNATLTATVSARRADLNCTALSKSQFNVTNSFSFLGGSVIVDASFPLPKECPFGGSLGNGTELDFQQTFRLSLSTNTSLVGKITDLHVGPFDDITMLSSDELDPTAQNSNPPGCPSLAFTYGYVNVNSDANTSIAVLVCYQQTDSILTETTFNAVDMSISQQNPPIPDESQRTTLSADANGAISFAYRPQLHFDSSLAVFNQTTFDSSSGNTEAPVDNFFQAVLFGKYPVPQSYFGDPSKPSQVYRAILGVYRRYMAQAISRNMRTPTTASGASAKRSQTTISATLYDPNSTLRVVQNATSKLILQGLLGATFVFMVAAVKLTRMNEVLQHNPCTIAGTATLWAASRYCRNTDEQIPVGAVWMSDKQLDEEVFAGWRFRLGWWDDLNGGRRWGIEGIRKVRDD